jgi:bacillithiol system protein YtxJ
MGKNFLRVDDKESLEQLLSSSKERPVVVFKHSNSCPISSYAYREMEKLEGEVNLLEIQAAQDVSKEVEDRTGIRHESPQVIVLRDGKAVWNASHYDVSAGEVKKAVEANI